MFISIIIELLGPKIQVALNVMKHSQTLIDDEYESINIASQKEVGSISGSINLNHTRYNHLLATK